MNISQISVLFDHKTPTDAQLAKIANIKSLARELAHCIMVECPASADRTDSIRKLRECVSTASDAIVLEGLI